MAIINLYDKYKEREVITKNFKTLVKRTENIFLSHTSEDKLKIRIIADYLDKIGYNVYLDEYDKFLQEAAQCGNNEKIVEAIKQGIQECDYLLCFISKKTKESWWVPYEIGVADEKRKKIFSLKDKEILDDDLPQFLKIKPMIEKVSELLDVFENLNLFYNKSNGNKDSAKLYDVFA